jgi:6-pyruvoyltetrahydropterin/6-carboxytetrahydropterin synthase
MYEVSVKQHFDAAHALRGYQGKCENLHGHRFEVEVTVRGETLNEIGVVYDFVALKEHLSGVLGHFDHTSLNDNPPFDEINPSSENIARIIFQELKFRLGDSLASVRVWESPDACATYSP